MDNLDASVLRRYGDAYLATKRERGEVTTMAMTADTPQRRHDDLAVPEWTLGDRLRKAREYAQIDRDEMAQRLHVTPGAISHWEGDRRRPADLLDVLHKWANETRVPVQWLLGLGPTSQSMSALPLLLIRGGQHEQLKLQLSHTSRH